MHFHGLGESLLASPKRTAVLKTLLRHTDRSWTGRELARASHVSPRWTIDTLRLLEAEGLVRAESLPPGVRWTVDTRHALLDILRPALDIDRTAQRALAGAIQQALKSLPIEIAIWFGSSTVGKERADSDIDLLLVVAKPPLVKPTEEGLLKAAGAIEERFGNRLAPIVLTSRSFDRKARRGFVHEAISKGTWLIGRPPRA